MKLFTTLKFFFHTHTGEREKERRKKGEKLIKLVFQLVVYHPNNHNSQGQFRLKSKSRNCVQASM